MGIYHENEKLIIEISDVITGSDGLVYYKVRGFGNLILSEQELGSLMRAADYRGRAAEEAWKFYKRCSTKGFEENAWAEQNQTPVSGLLYKSPFGSNSEMNLFTCA